jgi:HEAT repeat protein
LSFSSSPRLFHQREHFEDENEEDFASARQFQSHPRTHRRLDNPLPVVKMRPAEAQRPMINTKLWLLQRQLRNKSPQKRLDAVQKLRDMDGPEVVASIIQALEDDEPAVRIEAARSLGGFEGEDSVQTLIGALKDTSELVQESAIQALKKLGAKSAIEPLVNLLQRGGPGPQYHAAQALKSLGWIPRNSGEQIPYYVANGEFRKLASFGTAAINTLAAVLRGGSPERRMAVASVLGELGDPAVVKPLVSALKDAESRVRTAAAAGLGRLGAKQAAPELIALLKDRDRYARGAAAGALGNLGNPKAVDPLLALLTDRDWDVRQAAAGALGKLADKRALPGLMGLLKDTDHEVREAAAEALGKAGDESSLGYLALAMMDEEVGVRQAAARSLTMLDAYWERSPLVRQIVPEIEQAMRHQSASVQFAATSLMRRVTGKTSLEIQAEAQHASDTATGPHVAILIQLLRDSDETIRLAATESLGRIKSADGFRALQVALKDSSEWVREAALEGVSTQSQQ